MIVALAERQFPLEHAHKMGAVEQTGEMVFAGLLTQLPVVAGHRRQFRQQRIAQRRNQQQGNQQRQRQRRQPIPLAGEQHADGGDQQGSHQADHGEHGGQAQGEKAVGIENRCVVAEATFRCTGH